MHVNVYLDESGDGGWNADLPLGQGGSSRFYIYAMLIVPSGLAGKTKNLVKKTYRKNNFNYRREIKGGKLFTQARTQFCKSIIQLLNEEPSIKVRCVVLEKKDVPEMIREESFEILCNHMIHLGITNLIGFADNVHIFPDEKSIAKNRIYAAEDYLKARSWFDLKNVIPFEYRPKKGTDNFNIIFVDWIVNTVWRHYEQGEHTGFNILKENIEVIKLSF